MKLVMYGAEICQNCIKAKELLQKCEYMDWEYKNITANTATLKEFLSYRDHDPMFASVIKEGRIGIPFFILEDGTKTFDINDFINSNESVSKQSKPMNIEPKQSEAKQSETKQSDTKQDVDACSVDKKGYC